MLEQLPMVVRREFVIERHKDAATEEDGVGRDQPLRLIRHDDAGSSASGEAYVLQSFGQRMRTFFEISVSQALFFALAVRFDQAHFVRKLIQRIPQRFADRLILRQIQHRRLAIASERHGTDEGQGTNLLIP